VKPLSLARLTQAVPEALWAPAISAACLLVLGLLGWAVDRPLLFPSLGPTIFLMALQPADPMMRLYNVVAGHAIGMGMGFLFVWMVGAGGAPAMNVNETLPGARLAAAVLALSFTVLVQRLCRAKHVPAAATTLLCALGQLPLSGRTALYFGMATVMVGMMAEVVHRLRAGPIVESPLARSPGAA